MESCSNGSCGDGGSNNARTLGVVVITKLSTTVVEAILMGLALVMTTMMALV